MNIPILDSMSAFALMFQKQRDRQNPFHFAMQLHPEFKALLGSIFHLHLFSSLIESVVEFTFEEIRLRILSSSPALVVSASLPTVLVALNHPYASSGPLNHGATVLSASEPRTTDSWVLNSGSTGYMLVSQATW